MHVLISQVLDEISVLRKAQRRVFGKHVLDVPERLRRNGSVLYGIGQTKLRKAVLPVAEKLSGTAYLQILVGYNETVRSAAHYLRAFHRGLALAVRDYEAIGLVFSSAHAASELMHLGKSETLGILY